MLEKVCQKLKLTFDTKLITSKCAPSKLKEKRVRKRERHTEMYMSDNKVYSVLLLMRYKQNLKINKI